MGIRSNTVETDALVRRLLAAHVVDDPDAPANYSLQLEPPAPPGARTRPLHRLFEGGRELVMDPDPAALLDGLAAALGGFTPPSSEHLQVWATTFVGPGGAVLGPPEWRRRLPTIGRELRRTPWTVLDRPFASVDTSGRLVAPALPVPVDRRAAGLDGGRQRTPLSVLGWLVPPPAGQDTLTRAVALVEEMRLVRNRAAFGSRRSFALLADLVARVAVVAAPRTPGSGQVADLLDSLDHAAA